MQAKDPKGKIRIIAGKPGLDGHDRGIKVVTQGKPNPVLVSVSTLSAEEEAAPIVVAAAAAPAGKGKKTEKQNKK